LDIGFAPIVRVRPVVVWLHCGGPLANASILSYTVIHGQVNKS
jgi:hypothetical protein